MVTNTLLTTLHIFAAFSVLKKVNVCRRAVNKFKYICFHFRTVALLKNEVLDGEISENIYVCGGSLIDPGVDVS